MKSRALLSAVIMLLAVATVGAQQRYSVSLGNVRSEADAVHAFRVAPAEKQGDHNVLVWDVGIEERYLFNEPWVPFMRDVLASLSSLIDSDAVGSEASVDLMTDPFHFRSTVRGSVSSARVFARSLTSGFTAVVIQFDNGSRRILTAEDSRRIVEVLNRFEDALSTAVQSHQQFRPDSALYERNMALLEEESSSPTQVTRR